LLSHAVVAWPDARNASNIREIRARAESTKFNTPDGVVVGEEGIRRLTGLPLSCVPVLPPPLSLARARTR
jgi:glycerol kinase